jgi:hypothetical protein
MRVDFFWLELARSELGVLNNENSFGGCDSGALYGAG